MGLAAKDPRLQNVFTQYRINSPQVEINIDRNKAKAIGISLNDIFDTLEVELASLYVNNFTYLNRAWQVYVQADEPFRNRVSSLRGPLRQLGLGGQQDSAPVGILFQLHPRRRRTRRERTDGHGHDAAQHARANSADLARR